MAFPRFFYDNRFADNTPAASSTAAGNYAAANLADWRPYTYWLGTLLPATITVDCGVAKAADYALVMGHNLHSVGASVEIHGSTDNFSTSDVTVASGTPADDTPYLLTFASVAYRYWQLKLTGSTPPTVAIAAIGAKLEAPVGLAQQFDPLTRVINGQSNQNENGHPLGTVVYFEEWEQDLTFEKVSWSWVRSTFLPAWRSSLRGSPFAFGWDTDNEPSEILLVSGGNSSAQSFETPHYSGSVCDLVLHLSGVIT